MAPAAVAIEPSPPPGTGKRSVRQLGHPHLRTKGNALSARNQVFISYAHADARWKDEFTEMFKPAVRRGSISLWSDENIAVGEDWAKNIVLSAQLH